MPAYLRQADVTPGSRTAYGQRLGDFQGYLAEHQVQRPTRHDILNYKQALRDRHLAPATQAGYLGAAKRYFRWLHEAGLYENVAAGVHLPPEPQSYRRLPLDAEQCRRVLDRIDRATLAGLRDFAMINLLLRAGLRTIEVVRAEIGDIQEDSLAVRGKAESGPGERVRLTPEALEPLAAYLGARFGSQPRPVDVPLFASCSPRNRGGRLSTRSVRRLVKAALRQVGIDSPMLTAHSCRHTTATLALANGAGLFEVSRLLRHRSISSTLRYLHSVIGAEQQVKF